MGTREGIFLSSVREAEVRLDVGRPGPGLAQGPGRFAHNNSVAASRQGRGGMGPRERAELPSACFLLPPWPGKLRHQAREGGREATVRHCKGVEASGRGPE